jgi:hypothetical protein
MEDGTLSIRDGRATMLLRVKGSIIGRVTKGKLTITDSSDSSATIVVRGAENAKDLTDKTTVYSGTSIRFRIADDRKFSVRLSGRGLNFSVVGRGEGWIDGVGDPSAGIFYDGSYSLNGDPYRSLPNEKTPLQLAAPASPVGG